MNIAEFKKAHIKAFNQIGASFPIFLHNGRKVGIMMNFKSPSSNQENKVFIHGVFTDKIKKRIFYVGLDEELRHSFFGEKKPLKQSLVDLDKWSKGTGKYDDYEVWFAWKYDLKDDKVFDITPLGPDITMNPDPNHVVELVYNQDPSINTFRTKLHTLHECLYNIYVKRNHHENNHN